MTLHRRMLAIPLALIALAGCQRGTYYDSSTQQARSRLIGSEIPLMVFGSTAAGTDTVQRGQDTVIWRVLDGQDHEMIRLAAHITPDGKGSRIAAEVLPPEGINRQRIEQGLVRYPAIATFYGKVAEEQIDSAMNNREFEMAAITPAMMGAAIALSGEMQQQAMRSASDWQKADRDHIDQAYRDEASGFYPGVGPVPDNQRFGEPMDNPDPN